MQTRKLLSKYPVISDQVDKTELNELLSALEGQLKAGRVGAVVEMGCYIGTTSLFIRRLLDSYEVDCEFHVYDSFAGLPPKTKLDESPAGVQFKSGELHASKKDFIMQFKKAGLRLPNIHKAWFNDLTGSDIPDNVMFAYFDGDFYESIRDSFDLVTPKLSRGSIIAVDDYVCEALPGVQKAVDAWCSINHKSVTARANTAFIVV